MNWFSSIVTWIKARLYIKPNELKGAPGVGDPALAAAIINGVVSGIIDSQVATIAAKVTPAPVPQTLTAAPTRAVLTPHAAIVVEPAHLEAQAGVDDHTALADHVSTLLQTKIAETNKLLEGEVHSLPAIAPLTTDKQENRA